MRFTLGRAVHYYYVTVLILITALFAFGVKHYWSNGLLNNDYVSSLYDGTNRVKAVKERNDLDELRKFINGDRLKDAQRVFLRVDSDIKDLKLIKAIEKDNKLESELKIVGARLSELQAKSDLNSIINKLNTSVSAFENFVGENNWPTISRMTRNLRMKLSPSRLMVGGLYNFDRTQTLSKTIDNDFEALTNFIEASGLPLDIRSALINRVKVLKEDGQKLSSYVEDHQEINASMAALTKSYTSWFKHVEPEITLKKIEFEKNSQGVLYSLIAVFFALVLSTVVGFFIFSFSKKRTAGQTEKLILETIKDGLLPVDSKKLAKFSADFNLEFDKYKEYTHKRMSFGAIFQEAIPVATILLDSELNMLWGNNYFYEEWQLQNFKEDEDSLNWDFLQRFTNVEGNTEALDALKLNTKGTFDIQVKTNAMDNALPYEMHISPIEYAAQKRILVTFYPTLKHAEELKNQKEALLNPLLKTIALEFEESMTVEEKTNLRLEAEKGGSLEVFLKLGQYVEKAETIRDELVCEIENLEENLKIKHGANEDLKGKVSSTIDLQKSSIQLYSSLRDSFGLMLESRDQLEDQYKMAIGTSRDLFKEQSRVFQVASDEQENMDKYLKSLKMVSGLKAELKELKTGVDEYKSKVTQTLDQFLIFQGQESDSPRMDQFAGQLKIQMKGFEKVLNQFADISTQLDVSITKLDMLLENREVVSLDSVRSKIDAIKGALESIQFTGAKLSQQARQRDEDLLHVMKTLVGNLKQEIKQSHEMGSILKMNYKEIKERLEEKKEVKSDVQV